MTAMQSKAGDLARRPKVGSAVAANDKAADPGGLGLPLFQAPVCDVAAGLAGVSGGGAPGALTDHLAALLQLSLTDLTHAVKKGNPISLLRLPPPHYGRRWKRGVESASWSANSRANSGSGGRRPIAVAVRRPHRNSERDL